MVGEKIVKRLGMIPKNTSETLKTFKEKSLAEAIIGAAARSGKANRELLKQ